MAAFWTQDGDYVDLTGRVLNGRPAIEKDFENLFAENKGLKLRIEVRTTEVGPQSRYAELVILL